MSLLALQGKVQGRLRTEYPKLLVPAAEPGSFPLLQPLRLTSADDAHVVLMAVNSFGVSTHAYATFEQFRNRFDDAFGALKAEFPLPPLTRFGLRYINALPPFNAADNHAVHPALRIAVSGMKGRWRTPPQLVLETERGRMTLRTHLVQPPPATKVPGFLLDPGIRLDFDCYLTDPDTDVLSLLDEAHGIIEEAFFDIITPEYLKYLEGTE